MEQNCCFNPDSDWQETRPDLAVSIASCMSTGVVPRTGVQVDYNGLECENIKGLCRDAFEVADAQNGLYRAAKVAASVSTPNGEGE